MIVAQPTLDPADPAEPANPKVVEFAEQGVVGGLTPDQIRVASPLPAGGSRPCSPRPWRRRPTVDRAAVMNTLFALEDANFGLAP